MWEMYRGLAKEDGRPVEGYLVRHHDTGQTYILPELAYVCMEYQTIAIGGFVEVQSGSVVACTGLRDANEKYIYEEDVLAALDKSGEIRYRFVIGFGPCGGTRNVEHEVGFMGFYLKPGDEATKRDVEFGLRQDILYWLKAYHCVVVGNIHQKEGDVDGND